MEATILVTDRFLLPCLDDGGADDEDVGIGGSEEEDRSLGGKEGREEGPPDLPIC